MLFLNKLKSGKVLNLKMYRTHTNIPYRQQCVQFRKLQKNGKSLHPTVLVLAYWLGEVAVLVFAEWLGEVAVLVLALWLGEVAVLVLAE